MGPRLVVAGIATMPSRSATLMRAIESILPQVDRLYVFYDRFTALPPMTDARIVSLRSQEHGDLRAAGKFLGLLLCREPAVYFSIDDDIVYPPDYVGRMSAFLRSLPKPSIAGVHASFLKPGLTSYARDRLVADRMAGVRNPLIADVLGTDSVGFDTSTLAFDVRTWPYLNMVDLQFALAAARAGVERCVIPRRQKWLLSLERDQPDSISLALRRDDSRQTALAQELIRIAPRSSKLPTRHNRPLRES